MTIVDFAREEARALNGQFGEHEHTAPELSLPASAAASGHAASTISLEAPIGAVSASAFVDDETGLIMFSRYADANGFTVTSDAAEEIDDTFRDASVEAFSRESGVAVRDVDGEIWFDIVLDEM